MYSLLCRYPLGAVGEGDPERRLHVIQGQWIHTHSAHIGSDQLCRGGMLYHGLSNIMENDNI